MKQLFVFSLAIAVGLANVFANDPPVSKKLTVKYSTGKSDQFKNVVFRVDEQLFTNFETLDIYSIENKVMTLNKSHEPKRINNDLLFEVEEFDQPKWFAIDIFHEDYMKGIHSRFLGEPGDSITITNHDQIIKFSGKGAVKYECYQLVNSNFGYSSYRDVNAGLSTEKYFQFIDSITLATLKYLDSRRSSLNDPIYWTMKLLATYYGESRKFDAVMKMGVYRLPPSDSLIMLQTYKNPLWNEQIKKIFAEKRILQNFEPYVNFLILQYKFDSCMVANREFRVDKCYDYFTSQYTGALREWIIYKVITENERLGQDLSYCINTSFKRNYIQNNSHGRYLKQISSRLPGATAYNFSLKDTTGKTISLSDLKGKIVLLDFWFDGCGACVAIHPYLDSIARLFSPDQFRLVSICIDQVNHGRKRWMDLIYGNKYTSPENLNLLLQDESNSKTRVLYSHPLLRHYDIKGAPFILLIDKEGKVIKQPLNPGVDKGKAMVELIKGNLGPKTVEVFMQSTTFKGKTKATVTMQEKAFLSDSHIRDDNDRIYVPPVHVFENNGQSMNIALNKFIEPQYVRIHFDQPELEANFGSHELLLFPGDKITIAEGKGQITFSGNGAKRLECFYRLKKKASAIDSITAYHPDGPDNILSMFRAIDVVALEGLAILKQYEHLIPADQLLLLTSNYIVQCESRKYGKLFPGAFMELIGFKQGEYFTALKDYDDPVLTENAFREFNNNLELQRSEKWLQFAIAGKYINHYLFSKCFKGATPYNLNSCYKYIVDNYTSFSKEWIIYKFVQTHIKSLRFAWGDLHECIDDALDLQNIKNKEIKSYLQSLEKFAPGQLAYQFTLPDTSGKIIRLSDFKGKVVLIDTWNYYCGACTQVHKILEEDVKPAINSKDFIIVSVFRDKYNRNDWMERIRTGLFASEKDINIQAFDISSAENPKLTEFSNYYYPLLTHGDPNLLLIDKEGRLTKQPLDPRADRGADLINKIRIQLEKS